ncbi:hypothetical protein V2J09_003907 [Rumex salicifolius]
MAMATLLNIQYSLLCYQYRETNLAAHHLQCRKLGRRLGNRERPDILDSEVEVYVHLLVRVGDVNEHDKVSIKKVAHVHVDGVEGSVGYLEVRVSRAVEEVDNED